MPVPILQITTTKACPVNCYPYCPQIKFREAYGNQGQQDILSFEDFRIVLSHLPKDVQIQFSGFSEPFLNRSCVDMIELAKAEGYHVEVYSTLVGLKPEDVKRLTILDRFVLHLPDNRGIAHITFTETFKATLMEVLTTLNIADYYRMDKYFVDCERAGNVDGTKPRHVKGPFYCDKLVAPEFIMLPNCDVVLCCMDWTLKHVMGNLKFETFDEIDQGEAHQKIVRSRWNWSGTELCRSCKNAKSLPQAAANALYVYAVNSKASWVRGDAEPPPPGGRLHPLPMLDDSK